MLKAGGMDFDFKINPMTYWNDSGGIIKLVICKTMR
jgi:hypothetical protein